LLCPQLESIPEPVWGCIDEDGNILEIYRVPCLEPPTGLGCNDYLWGCWEDEDGVITLFTIDECGKECATTYIGERGICELCNCDNCICTTCDESACGLTYVDNVFVTGIYGPCGDAANTIYVNCDNEPNIPTGCGASGCFTVDDSFDINQNVVYGYIVNDTVSIWGCESRDITEITLPPVVQTVPNIMVDTGYLVLAGVGDCCNVYPSSGQATVNSPYCGEEEIVIGTDPIDVCDNCYIPYELGTCGVKLVFNVCSDGTFVAYTSEVPINSE
jgi:hypothetical protein